MGVAKKQVSTSLVFLTIHCVLFPTYLSNQIELRLVGFGKKSIVVDFTNSLPGFPHHVTERDHLSRD